MGFWVVGFSSSEEEEFEESESESEEDPPPQNLDLEAIFCCNNGGFQ